MEDKIKLIMEEYIENVNEICQNLLSGLNSLENLNLKNKQEFFEYRANKCIMEFDINGISYRLHGKGCLAFNKEIFIDWDFGYRSRWCGIDPWKLSMTLQKNNSNYVEYYDGNLIKSICEQAVLDGEMFEKYGQFYFSIPINETYEPEFPKEFDALIVEYFDSKWILPRNKLIDNFIRKSKRIYSKINQNKDKYTLKFMLDGKEVYVIPYDEIGYPENAVSIMSDNILRNTKASSKE